MSVKKIPLLKKLKEEYPEYSKDQLTAYVACKNVMINGELVTEPKCKVLEDSDVSFTFDKFVSRGGLKLEGALDAFGIDVHDLVMLDAGSSTGGFTDCLLQSGAKFVHAVDVGYNQLHWKLRTDPRVAVYEKTNIMNVEHLDPKPQGSVCDLSFRSVKGAASHILELCGDTFLLCLVKPQFELPRWEESFNGVITNPVLLRDTMEHVYDYLFEDGIGIHNMIMSPIKGRKGNTEFMALLKKEKGLSKEDFFLLYDNLVK